MFWVRNHMGRGTVSQIVARAGHAALISTDGHVRTI
jgi:hypothetical protein